VGNIRLYLRYISLHLRSQLQYRTSFYLLFLGQLGVTVTTFAGIYFLFQRFSGVGGFTYQQVLTCFGITYMAFTLAECFFRGFDAFAGVLGDGSFDRALVRPRGLVLQVLGARLELSRLPRTLFALCVLLYALWGSGIQWTAMRVVTLLLMLAGGITVFASLFLVYASLCFFTTQGLEVMSIVTDGGRELCKYPLSVYGKGILRIFTYCIPMALFQYYPFLYLMGESSHLFHALCPLLCGLFLLPCYGLWRLGVRHFKSTGS